MTSAAPAADHQRRRELTEWSRRMRVFLAHGPSYHVTYGRWRLRRWLERRQDVPALRAQDCLMHLDLAQPGLAEVQRAVRPADTTAAWERLADHFRGRRTPRFCFEPDMGPALRTLIPAERQAATVSAADQVCDNRFEFRGRAVHFAAGIDWAGQPGGSQDWDWDLNRHTYFETLGRAYWYTQSERYAEKFRTLALDWLYRNPPGVAQPNWSSVFEVALRLNTWLWGLYHFRGSSSFDGDLLRPFLTGVWEHADYVDRHLELHAANNHLLLEAKALALAGLAFPEFRQAARWRQRGLDLVYRAVRAQVGADGVHTERVTHYHRVITGELLELFVLLAHNGQQPPADIRQAFERMVEFELWATKPDQRLPLLGDSSLEDTHARFLATAGGPAFLQRRDLNQVAPPLGEAECWLLGPDRARRWQTESASRLVSLPSRSFPDGGYYVMRHGQGRAAAYLVFDAGPFGDPRVPRHGHADALSLELHAHGRTLLVDPGTFSQPGAPQWRNYFRGTRAHNTLVVDGEDQSILLGTRGVFRPAVTRVHHWQSDERVDYVDASHNGYARLRQPVIHRRRVLFVKPDYWLVIDDLVGRGEHTADLYFHFMPEAEPRLDQRAQTLQTASAGEPGLRLAWWANGPVEAELFSGDADPVQGWVALFSGEKRAAPVLRIRQSGRAPLQFCTVLYPTHAGANGRLSVEPLTESSRTRGGRARPAHLTGVRIATDVFEDVAQLDHSPPAITRSIHVSPS